MSNNLINQISNSNQSDRRQWVTGVVQLSLCRVCWVFVTVNKRCLLEVEGLVRRMQISGAVALSFVLVYSDVVFVVGGWRLFSWKQILVVPRAHAYAASSGTETNNRICIQQFLCSAPL
jgi:hypothetical protein